jgi:hypothetical protein
VAGLARPVRQRLDGPLWKGAEAQQGILVESRFTRIDPSKYDFGDSEKPPADYDRRLAKIDKAFKRNGVCVHITAHTAEQSRSSGAGARNHSVSAVICAGMDKAE